MVGSDATALWFGTGTSLPDSIVPASATGGGTRDNAINLGYSNSRFKDLYLSGSMKTGTNQRTSFGTGGFWDNASDGNNVGVRTGGAHIFLSDGNGNVTDGTRDIGNPSRRIRDIYVGGGVYLGGTGSADHLDDYEEGTWNVLERNGQAPLTVNRAHYTKIGNMVYAAASIGVGTTTNTNVLNFTLPFASSINGYYLGGGGVGYHTLPSTVQDNLRPNIENGADNVFFFYNKTSVVACNTASGKRIDFYVIYHTNA